MSVWNELLARRPPSREEWALAEDLLAEYARQGYLRRTCRAMLLCPDPAITYFYATLAHERPVQSPVAGRQNSGWMADADFCFVNVRATGLDDRPGHFLQAAKLLPALRVNAIHLAPFTDYDFDTIYAPRSLRAIAPQVVDPHAGLSPGQQLSAFVEAAHLLGMAVGFDLLPHVAQFAIPVLLRPELFRWIKLTPDRAGLDSGLSMNESLEPACQAQLAAEVRAIVALQLHAAGLYGLEVADGDDDELRERKHQAYHRLIAELIARGYWTIPAQSWAGAGVPAYMGYHHQGNYARFDYRDPDGADISASAYHIVTPFAFYAGVPANSPPEQPVAHRPAIDCYSTIFAYWRDTFDFDFVRYDSVDHVFDSVVGGDVDHPAADRPTPRVLQLAVERARSAARPYIGSFAERMGTEVDAYAELGFDLLLGSDMLRPIDRALIEDCFALADRLQVLNAAREVPCTVTFAIDTHDTGNPALWGVPLVQVAGPERMRLRHFVARFLHAGRARRPKYEVMGMQDLSYGLYAANVREVNLQWIGDAAFNAHYHRLEDVYEHLRPLLTQGELVRRHTIDTHAWWAIRAGDEVLVALAALECDDTTGVGPIVLDLEGLVEDGAKVDAYVFDGDQPHAWTLRGAWMAVELLPALSFRLFHVR